jgi:hypothetical protein
MGKELYLFPTSNSTLHFFLFFYFFIFLFFYFFIFCEQAWDALFFIFIFASKPGMPCFFFYFCQQAWDALGCLGLLT